MAKVRIIISALWAARMLSGLQGDTVRIMGPGWLQEMMGGESEVVATNELMLVMSIIMFVAIFMSFLTLTLRYPAIRWANLIIGIFFVAFDLVFLGMTLFLWQSPIYEKFWSTAYLVFTAPVVWYAWKWPKQEA
jgi:hypothetical protein